MSDNRKVQEHTASFDYSEHELDEAHRALLSTLHKCEKMDLTKLGFSQRTLLERRIAALKIALTLIERETADMCLVKGEKSNG